MLRYCDKYPKKSQSDQDRYRFGEAVQAQLGLRSKDHGGENEAVWTDYGQVSPEQVTLWRNYLLSLMD